MEGAHLRLAAGATLRLRFTSLGPQRRPASGTDPHTPPCGPRFLLTAPPHYSSPPRDVGGSGARCDGERSAGGRRVRSPSSQDTPGPRPSPTTSRRQDRASRKRLRLTTSLTPPVGQ